MHLPFPVFEFVHTTVVVQRSKTNEPVVFASEVNTGEREGDDEISDCPLTGNGRVPMLS